MCEGRFCGEGPSEAVVYYGNALVLHFHSDESYTFGGFRLHYSIDDGDSVNDGADFAGALDYAAGSRFPFLFVWQCVCVCVCVCLSVCPCA